MDNKKEVSDVERWASGLVSQAFRSWTDSPFKVDTFLLKVKTPIQLSKEDLRFIDTALYEAGFKVKWVEVVACPGENTYTFVVAIHREKVDDDTVEPVTSKPISALWDDDLIQFARLITAMVDASDHIGLKSVSVEMGVSEDEVMRIFGRAAEVCKKAKEVQ